MELSQEARLILEILAKEYEETPETRLKGIPFRLLGAKAGAYLDFPLYSVEELKSAGLVRELKGRRIILTEKGYKIARPVHRRAVNPIRQHPLISISIIVTIISIAVGLALLLSQGS